MKNTLLLICAGILMSFSSQAQKKKANSKVIIPEAVNASFQAKYSSSEESKWSKNSKGNYTVKFLNADKQSQVTEFDASGSLVRSKITYKEEVIPETISKSVNDKYTDAKITEVTKLELAGITPYYKVKIEQMDKNKKELLISEAGTIAE